MNLINYIIEHKEWIFSGIGVFVLGLFIFLYQQRQRKKDKVEQRVRAFVDNFQTLYKGGGCKLEVLVPAGIACLKNNKEIRDGLELLAKVIPKHSLRNWKDRVEKVGYKKFFDYVVSTGIELNIVSIEEFLGHFESSDRKGVGSSLRLTLVVN